MGNQYTNETVTLCDRIERMKKNLQKHAPELEYVRGFHHCDGTIVVKYKKCGHEREMSLITIRHRQHAKECPICEGVERTEKFMAEKARIGRARFNDEIRKVKTEQMTLKQCSQCGAFYFGFKKSSMFCSDECKERSKKQYINRYKEIRKKKCKTDESKYINLDALYKRDKGICWLCGKRCDITLDPNDNYYPSIDHVYPVSLGGKDTWDNIRLAHRICNTRKSNKIDMMEIKQAVNHSPGVI